MKFSNLAQRLEEFESDLESLRLTSPTQARFVMSPDTPEIAATRARPARRGWRAGAIRTRDQGLRSFRVC